MSLRTQLTHGLRTLLRRNAVDRHVDDEVQHYLAESAAEYRARGLSERDARRAARVDMGSRAAVAQQIRDTRWETVVESLVVDLRRAGRRLRHTPGFAVVTMLTLALGIGASTAIFSTVRPVVLQELPYPDPDRLAVVVDASGVDGAPIDVTFGTYREVTARSRSVESAAVSRAWQPTLTGFGDAERLDGQSVSADYFRVLGTTPALGRDFSAADDVPGALAVAIVSDGLWRRRLGADPGLVGRAIVLDGAPVTLVGVMPPSFENVFAPESRIWRPLGYDPALPIDGREWGHHLQMLVRVKPEASLAVARDELNAIARTPAPPFTRPAWANLRAGFVVTALQEQITTAIEPALFAVVVATLLLLLIAAVNVVNLMLARGAERRNEMAACAAFGASRLRLLTPLLAEAIVLAVAGGALGIALAYAMVGTLVTLEGFDLPRLDAIRVDRIALLFAAGLSVGLGILAGCVPGLLHSSGSNGPASSLRVMATHHRLRRGFVAAEVALALVLLVGAGLLVRTVQQLMAVDPGFRAEGVLTLQVQTSGPQFRDDDATRQFFDRVHQQVDALPGVTDAGLSSQLPFTGDADLYGIATREDSHLPRGADRSALRFAVSPGYLEVMDIPLVSGRRIESGDRPGNRPVAVVSESLARRRFPGRSALGEQLRVGGGDAWFTVVGVVGDIKQSSLATASAEAVYLPEAQWGFADRAMWVAVRGAGDPALLLAAIRGAIQSVDSNQPVVRVATMEQRVAASARRQRFVMTAFYVFALVALLLATIGVYGVLAAGVVDRTRELALRAAIGASRGSLVALVLRQAAVVAAIGTLAGGAVAVVMSRTLATLLFEVSPLDAATYTSVVLLMAAATAAGALIPAWRAARIAPAVALKAH